jgi:hypothetical protein
MKEDLGRAATLEVFAKSDTELFSPPFGPITLARIED